MGPLSDRFGRRPVLLASFKLYPIGALGPRSSPRSGRCSAPASCGDSAPPVLPSSATQSPALYWATRWHGSCPHDGRLPHRPDDRPLLGEMLLLTGVWQAVFLVGFKLALVGAVRMPGSARHFLTTGADRSTLRQSVGDLHDDDQPRLSGYILAMVFSYGVFFVFLGSSQPIVDEVYGRPGWFATFACTSAVNGFCVWQASCHVHRIGAARLAAHLWHHRRLRGDACLRSRAMAYRPSSCGWCSSPSHRHPARSFPPRRSRSPCNRWSASPALQRRCAAP